jgi:importin-5
MDLQRLLGALMSEDNDIRSQAESVLNEQWLHKAPDALLVQLAAQSRVAESDTVRPLHPTLECSSSQVRSFAVVLLRRVAFKTYNKDDDAETIWEATPPETHQQVKAALLEGYEHEKVTSVRNKICDTIADVARTCEEKSGMSCGAQVDLV